MDTQVIKDDEPTEGQWIAIWQYGGLSWCDTIRKGIGNRKWEYFQNGEDEWVDGWKPPIGCLVTYIRLGDDYE